MTTDTRQYTNVANILLANDIMKSGHTLIEYM